MAVISIVICVWFVTTVNTVWANCRNNYFQNYDRDAASVAIREITTNVGNRHFDLNLFRDTANQGVAT